VSRLSVTDVRNALKCPRFFVLCKKYGKPSRVFSGRFVGSMVHVTMQKSLKELSNPMIFSRAFKDSVHSKELVEKVVENFLYKHFYAVVESRLDKMEEISQIHRAWRLVRLAKSRIADLIVKTAAITSLEEVPGRLILGVEKPFKIKIEVGGCEVTLSGRIDAALRDPENGEVLLWDFKTGRGKNMRLDAAQLALYSYAVEELWRETPRAKLLYFSEEGLRRVEVSKDPERGSEIFKYILRMVKWLRGEEAPPRADLEVCVYCHLKSSCDEVFQ